MIAAVRRGQSIRTVAHRQGVSPATVWRWVQRAAGQRLDRADLRDQPSGRRSAANRTSAPLEDQVLEVRSELKQGVLGEYGARAIQEEMLRQGVAAVPTIRTIGRILVRRDAVSRGRRLRRPGPVPGWHLPAVAAGRAELDSLDVVEGLAIKDGPVFELLTVVSLHGGVAGAYVGLSAYHAPEVLTDCLAHWRTHGCPDYAQFDNDSRFQGPHSHRNVLSRVMRLCLSLQVTPVFVPPHEFGLQAAIENFNGLWQRKVWQRFGFLSVAAVAEYSARYVAARNAQQARRRERAPIRRPIAADWQLDLQRQPTGQIIFIRRTNSHGTAELLGCRFEVDRHWPYRLVRCTVDLLAHRIDFHALSRLQPTHQPQLNQIVHEIPNRHFHE